MPGRLINAGVLFNIAVGSAKQIEAPLREGGKNAALISIVFAVASLEAFINESIELAADWSQNPKEPPIVSAFAQIMQDFDRLRVPTESRFQTAHWVLTGQPYNKGIQPYQDFALLMKVRNTLVHYKPDPAVEIAAERVAATALPKSHSILEPLRAKGVLAELPQGVQGSWILLIGTKAVAEWACHTTSQIVLDLLGKLPRSSWGDVLGIAYGRSFDLTF